LGQAAPKAEVLKKAKTPAEGATGPPSSMGAERQPEPGQRPGEGPGQRSSPAAARPGAIRITTSWLLDPARLECVKNAASSAAMTETP